MNSFVQAIDGSDSQVKKFLMHHHLYNVLRWRCELLIWRNLLRRIFIVGSCVPGGGTFGFTTSAWEIENDGGMAVDASSGSGSGPPRIAFSDIAVAIKLSTPAAEGEQRADLNCWANWNWPQSEADLFETVFCLATRLIESGLLKGYISPSNQCIVISRKQPFPVPSEAVKRLMEKEQWWKPRSTDRRNIIEDDEDYEDD
jgi:hypothetical protein